MLSEVDICNMALGHIGEAATIDSIGAPFSSLQAQYCGTYYPSERDAALQEFPWSFASTWATLPLVDVTAGRWGYTHSLPADYLRLNMFYSVAGLASSTISGFVPPLAESRLQYEIDTLADGALAVRSDTSDAGIQYTRRITDTSKFSAMFAKGLSWRVASSLAGPIIRGDAGKAEAVRCLELSEVIMARAKLSDSQQRRVRPEHIAPWVAGRA